MTLVLPLARQLERESQDTIDPSTLVNTAVLFHSTRPTREATRLRKFDVVLVWFQSKRVARTYRLYHVRSTYALPFHRPNHRDAACTTRSSLLGIFIFPE